MKDNFWKSLKRPVFTLAPMEDVTDTVFREIVLSVSDSNYLHVLFSEFISTDGLCHEVGGPKVRHRLQINESERELLNEKNVKIVAQIWGTHPDKFYKATKLICEEGQFDGIDINMGCPVKKIVKQGGCSALIALPDLAKEIVLATKEASNIPVSIKTRIGINKVITEEWLPHLLECHPALITVHGRIQKQQSEGLADWNEVKKAVELRNSLSPETLIHGNGDVYSIEDSFTKMRDYHVDGVMIGRGIFHNPWFFNKNADEKLPEEKLDLLWIHTQLFTETWGKGKNFATLKRFFKIYTNGFPGAHQIRARLMETNSTEEVKVVLNEVKNFNIQN
jgi:nifR3 family TIM-barrel protein